MRCGHCSRSTLVRSTPLTRHPWRRTACLRPTPASISAEHVASGILLLRANDRAEQAQFDYTVPDAGKAGVWERLGGAAALLPGWGNVTPWVIRSGSQFRPDGSSGARQRAVSKDYNEIQEIG